jgi:hypothetical protein
VVDGGGRFNVMFVDITGLAAARGSILDTSFLSFCIYTSIAEQATCRRVDGSRHGRVRIGRFILGEQVLR